MKVRDAILKGTTEAEQLELIYKLFGTPTGGMPLSFFLFLSVSHALSIMMDIKRIDTYTQTQMYTCYDI